MPGTPIPTLFYGSAESAILLQTSAGQDDNGDTIVALAKSNPVAPAGASGECIFKNVYVTITTSMDITIRVTPIIDFVALDGSAASQPKGYEGPVDERVSFDIAPVTVGVRETHRFEIGLALPYPDSASERFRNAMRGAWFQVAVDTPAGLDAADPEADVIFEQVELEFEVVRESVQAEN